MALRFTAPSPKTEVIGREKTSLSGRLPANFVVCSAPGINVARLVAEGYATAATLYEATGRAVAACFSCGNMEAVARALRHKFPKLKLILCADNDLATKGNPGLTNAWQAARAVGGYVAFPKLKGAVPCPK